MALQPEAEHWEPPSLLELLPGKVRCLAMVWHALQWSGAVPVHRMRSGLLSFVAQAFSIQQTMTLPLHLLGYGLWQKEAVSHSCWLGCAWMPSELREVEPTTSITMAIQAAGCSRLNPLSVLCTICKSLLSDIWCLLTKNIVKKSCRFPTMTRSPGSTNWDNSQSNSIPGLQKWQVLDTTCCYLSLSLNAVNFFIMCVYPASWFCKSTCQILSYLDFFASLFYSLNSKHTPGKVQGL